MSFKKSILVAGWLGFSIAASAPADTGSQISGGSDYRLIFANHQGPEFDPNEDLLAPSKERLDREKLADAAQGAVLRSIVPLMGSLTGNSTGAEGTLLNTVMVTASALQASLKESFRTVRWEEITTLPFVQDVFLVPWSSARPDPFYGVDRISIGGGQIAHLIGITPVGEAWDRRITENVKELQQRLYSKSKDPAFLLGMRSFLYVSSKQESRLTLRILVGLKPQTIPFEQKNDQVHLKRIVVPELQGRGTTAVLTLNVGLTDKSAPPTMDVEFGDFNSYEKGEFKFVGGTQAKTAPRFEGNVNKKGLSFVATNFNFARLTFELTQNPQVSKLDILTSPGLVIRQSNWVVGGFAVEMVDSQFQAEINKTIAAEIEKAKTTAHEKLDKGPAGIMAEQWVRLGFEKIFGAKERL